MSFGNTITLSNGTKLPQVGFGSGWSAKDMTEVAVESAIRNGYRFLDLASIYGNQTEVGAALKKVIPSVVKREELFVSSKLWNTSHHPDEVEKALDETLSQLGIEYLDLYLIHWPIAFISAQGHHSYQNVGIDTTVTLVDTWKAMINLPKSKVRAIGVSNFTMEHIQAIIDETGVTPIVNEIEAHPLLPQDDLVAFSKEKEIHLIAYGCMGNNLLGKPKLLENPAVQAIANKLGATTAQVLLAWCVHRGYSVIPGSVQEDRIISNFKQIALSQEDYEEISSIGHNNRTRLFIPCMFSSSSKWDINVFDDPEEKTATFKVNIK